MEKILEQKQMDSIVAEILKIAYKAVPKNTMLDGMAIIEASDELKKYFQSLTEQKDANISDGSLKILSEAKSMWQDGRKLDAVKHMRDLGLGIVGAKAYCERHF